MLGHHTDLIIGQYKQIDNFDQDFWNQEFEAHHIIIFTPHTFLKILSNNLLIINQINVVIFDDCHLVMKPNNLYKKILKYIDMESGVRILGLTSCFTSKKCQDPLDLINTIQTLEDSYQANAETSTLVYSERYGIRPKEFIIQCDRYEDVTGVFDEIAAILENSLDFLNDCKLAPDEDGSDHLSAPKTVITECLYILYGLGPWCCTSIAQMFLTQLEKIIKHEHSDVGKKFLRYAGTQLRYVINYFEENFKPDYDIEELLLYSAPKIRDLVNHLRRFKPDYDFMIINSDDMDGMTNDDESNMSDDDDDSFSSLDESDNEDDMKNPGSKVIHVAVKKDNSDSNVDGIPGFGEEDKYLCGIVFVEHKYVAFALNKFIEEVCAWDEGLCFIKCHHITGQADKGNSKKDKACKKQEGVLRKFRMQELNLLFATDVLEEGVDIPKCNLIVKFNVPKDYRSYSQSKVHIKY